MSTNEYELGDAIRKLLDERNLTQKVDEGAITTHWESWMGKTIARYTREIKLDNGRLFINIQSAPLKNELLFLRENMMRKINEQLKREVVHEIVIL